MSRLIDGTLFPGASETTFSASSRVPTILFVHRNTPNSPHKPHGAMMWKDMIAQHLLLMEIPFRDNRDKKDPVVQ